MATTARGEWGAARMAALALVLAASVLFVVRGPMRADADSRWDANLLVSAAGTWLRGANPYSTSDVDARWAAMGGAPEYRPSFRGAQSLVYPPSGWAILSPLGVVGHHAATIAWIGLSVGLYAAALALMAQAAGLRVGAAPGLLFVAGGLALGAAHSCVTLGQTSILVLVLLAAGLRAREHGMQGLCGAMIGVACALKPQLAGLFLGYEGARSRWTSVVAAILTIGVLMGVGVMRMEVSGVSWLPAWRANVREFAAGHADPHAVGNLAYALINLQSPLSVLMASRAMVNALAWGALAILAIAYALVDWRRGREQGERFAIANAPDLVSLSLVACLTLLATYHRYYDAVLAVIPLALVIQLWRAGRRVDAGVTLALLLPLLVPGPAALAVASERGLIPEGLKTSMLWRAVILPHHAWALLALAAWLIAVRRRLAGPPVAMPVPG